MKFLLNGISPFVILLTFLACAMKINAYFHFILTLIFSATLGKQTLSFMAIISVLS